MCHRPAVDRTTALFFFFWAFFFDMGQCVFFRHFFRHSLHLPLNSRAVGWSKKKKTPQDPIVYLWNDQTQLPCVQWVLSLLKINSGISHCSLCSTLTHILLFCFVETVFCCCLFFQFSATKKKKLFEKISSRWKLGSLFRALSFLRSEPFFPTVVFHQCSPTPQHKFPLC